MCVCWCTRELRVLENLKLSHTCIKMCIGWNQKVVVRHLIFLCCASCRAAVVTNVDILCMCVCVWDGEQESCYSVMNVCALNFMCCASCTCVSGSSCHQQVQVPKTRATNNVCQAKQLLGSQTMYIISYALHNLLWIAVVKPVYP